MLLANLLETSKKNLKKCEKLEENKKEMKDLDGYDRIYATITNILRLLPLTDGFLKDLEEQLRK